MTAFVQNLLQQMLEQSINDLRSEMGVECSPSPVAAAKPSEEAKEEGTPILYVAINLLPSCPFFPQQHALG
ncbi:hypothetical protein CR513_16364 [Mucuna pruriens]|uniref:Uncharacterized protein n=1 Tax=Mucuna pruriens TaxID=157652 RepID=A0A371HCC9_MUCPR|nr:hypothetical protein CR513_16364 [Mucuna pruriens]